MYFSPRYASYQLNGNWVLMTQRGLYLSHLLRVEFGGVVVVEAVQVKVSEYEDAENPDGIFSSKRPH